MQNEILKFAFDQSAESILIVNSNGMVVDYNDAANRFFTLTNRENKTISVSELLPELKDFTTENAPNEIISAAKKTDNTLIKVKVRFKLFKKENLILLYISDISKRITNEENIKGLNNSILKLLSFQNVKAMYRFVGEQLHKYLPSAIILVHSYDKYDSSFLLEEIFGLEESSVYSALSILNTNSKNLKFKLDQDSKNYFIEGKLIKYEGDFVKISRNYLEKDKAQKIQNLFSINHIYLMGVVTNSELEIAVQIYTSHETDINNVYFVETLLYQTSIAINRKHLEKELIAATFKAKEASEAKSRFLATMSHEIRTPLNSIIGFIDLLNLKIEDKTLKSYIKNIRTNSEILLNLINDILDLSKIEAGKTELFISEISINNLLEELKQNFEYQCNRKGLSFDISFTQDLPEAIYLDEIKLKQILNNLISNAIKFTDTGTIHIRFETEILSDEQCNLIIIVCDTGIGIRENDLKKIMQPFQQQENQDNRKFGGTGLGLSIVQNFVELMNGEISIHSEINKGSIFTIRLKNMRYKNYKERKIKKNNLKIPVEIIEKINIILYNPNSIRFKDFEDFLIGNQLNKSLITDIHKLNDLIKPSFFNLILYIENLNEFENLTPVNRYLTHNNKDNAKVFLLNKANIIFLKSRLNQLGIHAQFSSDLNPEDLFQQLFESVLTSPVETNTYYNQKEISGLNIAIQQLKSELLPMCEMFKTNQPMKEVEKFALLLLNIGEKNQVAEIRIFGERLLQHVEQYDIENMRLQLKLFPHFVENLEFTALNT